VSRRPSRPRHRAIAIGVLRPKKVPFTGDVSAKSGVEINAVELPSLQRRLAVAEAALQAERRAHQETKDELDRVMARVLRLEGDRARKQRHRILLVDDHHELREMYAEYLEYAGYEVAQAVNGHHAFDVALRRLPSLIVMDLAMPQLDGWEATRLLREDSRTEDIPIIALTGFVGEEHAELARDAGCTLVVTKPCLPDELRCIIADRLDTAHRGARDGKPISR